MERYKTWLNDIIEGREVILNDFVTCEAAEGGLYYSGRLYCYINIEPSLDLDEWDDIFNSGARHEAWETITFHTELCKGKNPSFDKFSMSYITRKGTLEVYVAYTSELDECNPDETYDDTKEVD